MVVNRVTYFVIHLYHLGDGLETNGDQAFDLCSPKQKGVTIPKSVKSIGNDAFGYIFYQPCTFPHFPKWIPYRLAVVKQDSDRIFMR